MHFLYICMLKVCGCKHKVYILYIISNKYYYVLLLTSEDTRGPELRNCGFVCAIKEGAFSHFQIHLSSWSLTKAGRGYRRMVLPAFAGHGAMWKAWARAGNTTQPKIGFSINITLILAFDWLCAHHSFGVTLCFPWPWLFFIPLTINIHARTVIHSETDERLSKWSHTMCRSGRLLWK